MLTQIETSTLNIIQHYLPEGVYALRRIAEALELRNELEAKEMGLKTKLE